VRARRCRSLVLYAYRKRCSVDVQVDARKIFLSALLALVVLASALLVIAPKASANKEDCPAGKVCLWAGPTFGGERAFFNGEELGCHSLASINPRSAWNHTGNKKVTFPGLLVMFPGAEFSNLEPAWPGEICISNV
jgi:hypothetical protein